MTTGKLLATAGILLALVSLSFLPAAAQSYTVWDLGTLGGNTTALGINDRGQVVGLSHTFNYGDQAFLWSPAVGIRALGVINRGDQSWAYSVNINGEVVGKSWSVLSTNAFLWTQAGGIRDLGSLGGGGSVAYGINDSEQVVGQSSPDGFSYHSFLWTQAGGMQDIGTLGGSFSAAYGINNAGQVIGVSYLSDNVTLHAFSWTQAGGMQDLGTLGGTTSRAVAVNGLGEVLGVSDQTSGIQGTFLWTESNGMSSIPALANTFSNVNALNSRLQIVGNWISGNRGSGFVWSKAHGTQNLLSLIPPGNGTIADAHAINNNGQIAVANDRGHALLLTPTK